MHVQYYQILGIFKRYSYVVTKVLLYTLTIGYEPADLTVHPPPRMIEGGFIFFVWVSIVSPTFFPKKKSGFCRRYSHSNAPKRGFTS